MTPGQLADKLGVSTKKIYTLVRYNKLPYYRVGRVIRFNPVVVAEWLEALLRGARPSQLPVEEPD